MAGRKDGALSSLLTGKHYHFLAEAGGDLTVEFRSQLLG
jgi:hypothetical protein